MPRTFLAERQEGMGGILTCRDDVRDWLWTENDGLGPVRTYAVDATRGTMHQLFGFSDGSRFAIASLTGDGRAIVAFDAYRDGTLTESTENLTCDNDRPWAEPCAADYVFYKTSVSTTTLLR